MNDFMSNSKENFSIILLIIIQVLNQNFINNVVFRINYFKKILILLTICCMMGINFIVVKIHLKCI